MTTEENILYGGPDVPFIHNDAKSLGEMILRQFKENAQSVCFVGTFIKMLSHFLTIWKLFPQVNAATGQTMTVGELHLHSVRLANSLRFDGVVPGDTIGLCSENRAEFPVVLFAGFLLGATIAPLNTTYINGT